MKIIDIAYKDMLRYFRSAFAVGMMLVVPLLITGLIYAAFGGVLATSETDVYTLPVIKVQVVNLDQGDETGQLIMGNMLLDALGSETVKNVFELTVAEDETSAQAAVDGQRAALAMIIPQNFTQAALAGQGKAVVVFYQDPTLSFGPGITREIISQFLDALTGGQIASSVLNQQFTAQGLVVDAALAQQVQADYAEWFRSLPDERDWNLPIEKRLPNSEESKSVTDHRNSLMGPVMAGMLIFFVFFTGANTAQSMIKEQEEGTLARLFTTPTLLTEILGGKFSAVFATLAVQSIVLIIASALVFGIDWGNIPALTMVIIGLVVSAAGFGIMLMSFIKNSRQAGAVVGGVITIMGMAGGLFTNGLPGAPALLETASKFVPQGWALLGMQLVLFGAEPEDVILPFIVLLVFGIVFFAIGVTRFNKRFA